ncbi:DUF4340 domain-containing protein [Deferrisoma camini]|uniref:DUF4340 domain-containing protein n=1 Tax=Deferrisoma camini TaxID=1035120 RepID=UPI00046D3776|nr:DUF4340 domain-containing protein [Deferrisoma camini]
MRFKSTWIVIGIFAALAAYLYFVDQPRYEAKQEAEKKEGLLFPDLDTDKITELVIERGGKTARVKKGEDDKWFLVEPVEDRADDGRVRTLLSDLKNMKAKKEVAPADAELEPFGLKEPEAVIRTKGAEITLAVGAKNPVGDARFVRVDDGPVHVVQNYALSGFLKDVSDLRNKDVLESFSWTRLEGVTIRPADGSVVRLVKKDERWYLEEPFQAEADPDEADKVTDKLRWARINRFLDPSQKDADEKLAKGIRVELKQEGQADPVVVEMAEVDGQVWARTEGRNALFTINKDVYQAFRVDPEKLRRTKPVLTKVWKVKKLELAIDGETLLYEKDAGKWKRGGAEIQDAERQKLDALLRAFENTRADEVIGSPGEASRYGLDQPAYTATLTHTGDKVQELVVAEKDGSVYAQAGSDGPVYKMPKTYLDAARTLLEAAKGTQEKATASTESASEGGAKE